MHDHDQFRLRRIVMWEAVLVIFCKLLFFFAIPGNLQNIFTNHISLLRINNLESFHRPPGILKDHFPTLP